MKRYVRNCVQEKGCESEKKDPFTELSPREQMDLIIRSLCNYLPGKMNVCAEALFLDLFDLKTYLEIGVVSEIPENYLSLFFSRYLRVKAQILEEKYDGSGFLGIQGWNIPLSCRCLAVVRFYMKLILPPNNYTKEEAFEFLRLQSGKSFDPTVVEVVIKAIENPVVNLGCAR